jgi:hypothetical protein
MGNTVICRLTRRLALTCALVAALFVFVTSTTSAVALLDGPVQNSANRSVDRIPTT